MTTVLYKIGDVIKLRTLPDSFSEARYKLVVNEIDDTAVSALSLVEKTEANQWLTLVIRTGGLDGSESGLLSDHVVVPLYPSRISFEWIETKVGSIPLTQLKEIVNEVAAANAVIKPPATRQEFTRSDACDRDSPFTIGQHVKHAKFGIGTVTSIGSNGAKLHLSIKFDDLGLRTIDSKFVVLSPGEDSQPEPSHKIS